MNPCLAGWWLILTPLLALALSVSSTLATVQNDPWEEEEEAVHERYDLPSDKEINSAVEKIRAEFSEEYDKAWTDDKKSESESEPEPELVSTTREHFNEHGSRALAEKLLKLSLDARDEPSMLSGLLRESYQQAIFGFVPSVALAAVDSLEANFVFADGRQMRIDAICKTVSKVHPSRSQKLAEVGLDVLEQSLNYGDGQSAERLLDAFDPFFPRLIKGKPTAKERLKALKKRFAIAKPFFKARRDLERDPSDPVALKFLGFHLCFDEGEFKRGLTMLATGCAGEELAQLAKDDLGVKEGPQDPDRLNELGERWVRWGQKQSGNVQKAAIERAIEWIARSLETLPVLEKRQRQLRIEQLQAESGVETLARRRRAKRVQTRASRGGKADQALRLALTWLKQHQSPDGSWDTDGFMNECGKIGNSICDGAGRSQHDVGNTGLALLALLGAGNTSFSGDAMEEIATGVQWLRWMQDSDSGLIGEKSSHAFLYNHAIATLALCEAYAASQTPQLKDTCQKAINYINRARDPYSAWRYDEPPMGLNDTSVTGWMVFAIKSAQDAKLQIDQGAYEGAMSWIDEATDTASGRVGYNEMGSLSSRINGVNDHFPADKGESMTAVGLLSRIFMGQDDPSEHPILKKHGELLLKKLPEWDPDGFGTDMYYWYYGSYAMYQLGGKYWGKWEKALKPAVIDSQNKNADSKGSWDPVGPWGFAGGRVYSTALLALCIEVYFRYPNVGGSR